MVEAVGGERSSVTSSSMASMRQAALLLDRVDPDVVIVCSPHAPSARDGFLVRTADTASGDLGQFGAPTLRWSAHGDPELGRAVLAEAADEDIPAAVLEDVIDAAPVDHGTIVPMSFLDPAGARPFVGVSISFAELQTHQAFGRAVRRAADRLGRRVVFVASGDLSHRLTPDAPAGYAPEATDFDEAVTRIVRAGDLGDLLSLDRGLIAEAGECGLRSFVMLAGFLADVYYDTRVLSYEGPWGVGYLTAVAGTSDVLAATDPSDASGSKGGRPGDAESPQVALARRAIEAYVREGRLIEPPRDESSLSHRAGAFVSLHRGSELRGCIGSVQPSTASLAEEIVAMAVQAATQDPRFPPLTADELADLQISVDVLSDPEPIDGTSELDPARYGVIVSRDWRRGLLLPDLDGVDSPEQQVAIACRKAGISPDEQFDLERFEVERFH
jgi:AmmeMemoRadiSam system protein A